MKRFLPLCGIKAILSHFSAGSKPNNSDETRLQNALVECIIQVNLKYAKSNERRHSHGDEESTGILGGTHHAGGWNSPFSARVYYVLNQTD